MQLRVVTDPEKEAAKGLAPAYPSLPRTKEELLQPFEQRERVLVIALGDALETIVADGERGGDPHATCLEVWRGLIAAFGVATGMQWQGIPWR